MSINGVGLRPRTADIQRVICTEWRRTPICRLACRTALFWGPRDSGSRACPQNRTRPSDHPGLRWPGRSRPASRWHLCFCLLVVDFPARDKKKRVVFRGDRRKWRHVTKLSILWDLCVRCGFRGNVSRRLKSAVCSDSRRLRCRILSLLCPRIIHRRSLYYIIRNVTEFGKIVEKKYGNGRLTNRILNNENLLLEYFHIDGLKTKWSVYLKCSIKIGMLISFELLPMFECFNCRQIFASRSSFWWSLRKK